MAKFRAIQTEFWQDDFTLSLTPEEKYFYLYLCTNTKANQLGCYVLPKKVIEFETGYNSETIDKLLSRFEEYEKIKYDEDTKEILIINWYKYNWLNSINTFKCMLKEIDEIKNEDFIAYIWQKIDDMGYLDAEPYKGLIGGMETPYEYLASNKKKKNNKKNNKNKKNNNNNTLSPSDEEQEDEDENNIILTQDLKDNLITTWNLLPISKIQTISPNRIKKIRILMQQYSYEDIINAINNIGESKFLQGINNRSWQITFDWFLNPNNFIKVLEGNYKDKIPANNNYINTLQDWVNN